MATQVLNPNAVTLVGYQIGTIPSNLEPMGYCHGPGLVNTDFSIDKNWRVWGERMRIQFRFDIFNLFNHANFNGGNINGINGGSDRCLGELRLAQTPRESTNSAAPPTTSSRATRRPEISARRLWHETLAKCSTA